MIICGVDFEATSVDPKEGRIIEVGAALWDTEMQAPIAVMSQFVEPGMDIPEEITKLTGITNAMAFNYGVPESSALRELDSLIDVSEYCMAHNGTVYDVPLWRAALARHDKSNETTPWIDSRTDIKFPDSITTRNLKHLAAELGFINPFPHRALFDVMTMFKIASQFKWGGHHRAVKGAYAVCSGSRKLR